MTIHTIDLHFQGIDQAIAAYLVETSAGPVLIEAGPYSTFASLQAGLAAHQYQISDLQAVLLSHIHFDHAGAAWALAKEGLPIYVHPKGHKHLAAPERLYESARRIYQDKMDVLWGAMEPIDEALLHCPEDQEVVTIGDARFVAHYTPGHATHHIAWQLDGHIFTGDVGGVKIGTGPVQPPCPPPDIAVEDWLSSIDRILSLKPSTLYLTHYGPVNEPATHLQQLREELEAWANWIKPHWEAGTEHKAVIPLFMDFVGQRLSQAGVGKAEVKVYEAANPAWMSVAGLMRYWEKSSEKDT